jgi:hypothetical protein
MDDVSTCRDIAVMAGSTVVRATDLDACKGFVVMVGSTATCAGSFDCDIVGRKLGVSPGTSITGNFVGVIVPTTEETASCAAAGLDAWNAETAARGEVNMLAEMGGCTFTPGVYTAESSINIAFENPKFIFNAGSTLMTCAGSEIVLLNGARPDNVYWFIRLRLIST